MARALINVPSRAKAGEIVEIKALIAHPMETGYRHDTEGKLIPRDIINHFVCSLDGEPVFEADLFPAMSANPFIAFPLRAEKSGTLTFSWIGDGGKAEVRTAQLIVE